MGKGVTGIVMIMGAIGVIYLAASGNLDSAWRGVRGQCGSGNGDTARNSRESTNPTGNIGGHAMRGNYYGTPIGQLYVSDAGVY